jgi:hypothetical protein
MRFERSPHGGPDVRFQALKVVDGFRGEDDVERSGSSKKERK